MQYHPHLFALTAASLGFTALALPALAQDAGDIGLTVENGRIQTNLIAEEGDGAFVSERVFLAEFGEVESEAGGGSDGGPDVFPPAPDLPFVTNTPGFDSPTGTFTPGTAVNFTVRSGVGNLDGDLRVYDPISDAYVSTDVALGTALTGGAVTESLGISFNASPVETNPAVPGNVTFPTQQVFSDGRYHRHFIFTLLPVDDPSSTDPMFAGDDGVYLLELVASTTTPGIDGSDPFFILLPFGVEEDSAEFQNAVAAANALVPEPTGLALLAVGGPATLGRRRRATA